MGQSERLALTSQRRGRQRQLEISICFRAGALRGKKRRTFSVAKKKGVLYFLPAEGDHTTTEEEEEKKPEKITAAKTI